MSIVYEIENLEEARAFLSFTEDKVVLTTMPGSVKYYGMLVVDYVLKDLSKAFSNKIEDVIIDIGDDHAALFTAIKLGYKNIVYTGDSEEAKGLLRGLSKP
ncbi:MAG TPA: hypothetical protein LFW21_04560 [Rickettsia endosymbiont of Pyrocoelia pectoralis]|nr:hypothetical protein [Rickettsia endosymbiont of Pyrocoelia pectoralis]